MVDGDNKCIFIPNIFEYIYACGSGRMGGRFPGSLAVWQWVGDLWSIADRARKKKRNICSLYDSVGNLKKIYNSTGDEAGDPVVLYHDVHGVHRVQVMV